MVSMLELTKELSDLREKASEVAKKLGDEAKTEFDFRRLMVRINELKVMIEALTPKEDNASSK